MTGNKNFKRREATRRRNAGSTVADGAASTVQQRNAAVPGYNPVPPQFPPASPATRNADTQPTATLAVPTTNRAGLNHPVTLPALPDLELLFPEQTSSASARDAPGLPLRESNSPHTVVAQSAQDDANQAPSIAAPPSLESSPAAQHAIPTRLRSGTAKSSPARLGSHLSPQKAAAAGRASSHGTGFAPMPEAPQHDDDEWTRNS